MAISIPTIDTVIAQVLALYRNRFPGRDLGTESFLGKLARAEAMEFFLLLQSIQNADNDATPTSKTSSAALAQWAITIGVPSSTSGTYGAKTAVAATGGAGNITGTSASVQADQSLLTASDGVTVLKLSGTATIPGTAPGTGTVSGAVFVAVTAGAVGNLPVGSVLTWQSPAAGIDSTVTLTTALTGGFDIESNASLLSRILQKMQLPPKGGTSADYRAWAEAQTGVNRAYEYPLRGGSGTVHIAFTLAGSGGARILNGVNTQTIINNYINGTSGQIGTRPVTSQGYTTVIPNMPAYGIGAGNTGGLTIRTRVTGSKPKYNFDWVDTAGWTVASYNAGVTPNTLTLNTTAPTDLTNNANSLGLNPRIQILVSTIGGPVIPLMCTVSSVSGAVLTLQNPLPTGWVVPTNGDKLYAGGPVCTQIATAILAYIDSLGPSRAGGYAESTDVWEDTAAIARITQIALDQVDTDGTRLLKNLAIVAGTTIANGTNAAAAVDVQALDNTVQGVELLYAKWIAVTQ